MNGGLGRPAQLGGPFRPAPVGEGRRSSAGSPAAAAAPSCVALKRAAGVGSGRRSWRHSMVGGSWQ
jgi:hypothetical protein